MNTTAPQLEIPPTPKSQPIKLWRFKSNPETIVKPLFNDAGEINQVQIVWSKSFESRVHDKFIYPYDETNLELLSEKEMEVIFEKRQRHGLTSI